MFCINCGKPLDDDDRFCRYCGAEIKYTSAANAVNTGKNNTDIRDIEERVRRRSAEINKKPGESIRVENIEVMLEREVTFADIREVPEESTEVMPDHEVTFMEEGEVPEESTEVMPDHEVTFMEDGEVTEESTEVMPDHEITFTEENEEQEEKGIDDSDKIPTEDMILSQTIKLLKEKP